MNNIIIEGADNSGKSTLVDTLAHLLNRRVVRSEGPTRTAPMFVQRAQQFLGMQGVIFDRHCIVSERIYGAARGYSFNEPHLEKMFYGQESIIVLCRGDGTLGQHRIKEHDTEEHLRMVSSRHRNICAAYDVWGLERAHIIYRKGEDAMKIYRFIKGELRL